MSRIMKENSHAHRSRFFGCNFMTFLPNFIDGILHQVHGTNGVMVAVVQGTWVYKVRQPELRDSSQTLKIWVIDYIQKDAVP